MIRPTKQDLLKDYKEKDVRKFLQIDGFATAEDTGEQELYCVESYELRSTFSAVRIYIDEAAKREEVVSLLEKLFKWVSSDGFKPNFENLEKGYLQRACDFNAILQILGQEPMPLEKLNEALFSLDEIKKMEERRRESELPF